MMEGYSFIRNNTAPDALIINWWDYGNDIVYRKNSRYLKNLPNIEWVNIKRDLQDFDCLFSSCVSC